MSVNANNAALNEILEAINELPEAGSGKEEIEKTVDIIKNGETVVTPDDENTTLSKVTINVSVPEQKEEQEKIIDITENGTTEVTPDEGMALSKVTVNVGVESSGEDTLRGLLTNMLTELVIYDAVSLAGFRVPIGCTKLLKFVAPNISAIDNYSLYGAAKLQYIDLGRITRLDSLVINGKHYINVLILRSSEAVALSGKFTNSKCLNEGGFDGYYTYIYVPKALIEDYKVATNWSNYANRFRAIEDYPEITGGVI